MPSRSLRPYRLFRCDEEPGIGLLIPEGEPFPVDLHGLHWIPTGQTLLSRPPAVQQQTADDGSPGLNDGAGAESEAVRDSWG